MKMSGGICSTYYIYIYNLECAKKGQKYKRLKIYTWQPPNEISISLLIQSILRGHAHPSSYTAQSIGHRQRTLRPLSLYIARISSIELRHVEASGTCLSGALALFLKRTRSLVSLYSLLSLEQNLQSMPAFYFLHESNLLTVNPIIYQYHISLRFSLESARIRSQNNPQSRSALTIVFALLCERLDSRELHVFRGQFRVCFDSGARDTARER